MIRKLFNLDVLERTVEVAHKQKSLIRAQSETIKKRNAEIERLKLEHVRQIRDLVEQFWLAQMEGTDVLEPLERGLQDLRDHVARLEEHAPR